MPPGHALGEASPEEDVDEEPDEREERNQSSTVVTT